MTVGRVSEAHDNEDPVLALPIWHRAECRLNGVVRTDPALTENHASRNGSRGWSGFSSMHRPPAVGECNGAIRDKRGGSDEVCLFSHHLTPIA